MHHFHSLTVLQVNKQTRDCVHILFELPIELVPLFKFKQGQYLNIRLLLEGEDLRRSYSLVNAPSEKNPYLEILVKKMEDGRVSRYINDNLKAGDTLDVMPPMGGFYTAFHPSNEKKYVGIAAGSGISPVFSNLKEALIQEPNSKAYLFFSNRSENDIIFRKELDSWEAENRSRLKIVHVFSREKHRDGELFEGRITGEKLGQLLQSFQEIDTTDATYFICGPSEMIKDLSGHLRDKESVPSLQILYEYYSAPDEDDAPEMSEEFKAIANIESMVTLIIDDDEYSFHLNSKKNSILDQALKENLPVPFACKGGVCCTCKAQIMEGEVFMEKNFALTPAEVENGYVLTCQCHPTTNVVMLNYDV